MEATFRKMTRGDVDEVYEIELENFSYPWAKQAFEEECQNKLAHYIVATVGRDVVAYGGMWFVLDEANVTNIAVKKSHQSQKIGQRLIEEMIETAKKRKVKYMYLEVRQSNEKAIYLYKKLGFIHYGVRQAYYPDNNENALLMMRLL